METAPSSKGSRSDLPSELRFALAPRETDPTPVVTLSSEVSRVEPTLPWLLGHAQGKAVDKHYSGPEIEFRLVTETRPEPEIQISMSTTTTCEGGLGAARTYTTDTASQYVTADKPEATATFTTSPKKI